MNMQNHIIDIHSHIIFGVDDGSATLDMSMEMAQMAVENGVYVMVATPHTNMQGRFENYESAGECRMAFQELKSLIREEGIPLQLLRGAEIFGVGDVQGLIRHREIISLNHTGYYLIEFPFNLSSDMITEGLTQVVRAGGRPVIAHPERYYCVQEDPNLVFDWMSSGVLSQVNGGSFLGKFGRKEERTAHTLLEHQLITCLGSDTHTNEWRRPDMGSVYQYIASEYDPETADVLMHHFPKRILEGKTVVNPEIRPVERKRSFFF